MITRLKVSLLNSIKLKVEEDADIDVN